MKLVDSYVSTAVDSRSRKGAWIEIMYDLLGIKPEFGRSRKGAWIEIEPKLKVDIPK